MAKRNGSSIKILSDGATISNLKNVSMVVDGAVIDVTTKDSAGWRELLTGLKKASMSGAGTADFGAAFPPSTIFTKLSAGTSCAILFYDSVAGDKSYSASGYYTKFELKAGTEDEFTFDFSIEVTGAVSQVATT